MSSRLRAYGLGHDAHAVGAAQEQVSVHIQHRVIAMTTVMLIPSHHSDLQPIVTVWAIAKAEVGRQ
ncbi:hypothetical protein ACHHYP_20864 [Achlya hypogyna]|uniref:Uncharacterized protein n=1 Tax=Achlya hypogyna TaxID=1202772 RepID=A0A1V9Y4M8_ACHHY|nr:hypothetical protein ACHHYP_20864 [Achlya hypogyna]